MTTLITGATGFVGRHLVQTLLDRERPVRGAVRVVDPTLMIAQSVVPLAADDVGAWRPLVRGCSTVIHLLARAHILKEDSSDPLSEFRLVNTAITHACAEAAAIEGVRRFILVSSVGVHGNVTYDRAFHVDDLPAPHSPYAISKLEAEQALRSVADEYAMEYTIVRPPLVYGQGAPGNMNSMMNILRRNLPLPLASVTGNRRSFVSVENLVDLLITCLDYPGAARQTFLVSDGEDLSTADLLRRLAAAMGQPARLFPVPVSLLALGSQLLRRQDMAQRLLGSLQVDIAHTCETLDWQPPVPVNEGLARMVNG